MFVKIALYPSKYFDSLFVALQSRDFSHIFANFSLSRCILESKELSIFDFDRSLSSFPVSSFVFIADRNSATGLLDVRVSARLADYPPSLFTATCTSFGWDAIGYSRPSALFGESAKDSLTFGFQTCRTAYANASAVLYRRSDLVHDMALREFSKNTRVVACSCQ